VLAHKVWHRNITTLGLIHDFLSADVDTELDQKKEEDGTDQDDIYIGSVDALSLRKHTNGHGLHHQTKHPKHHKSQKRHEKYPKHLQRKHHHRQRHHKHHRQPHHQHHHHESHRPTLRSTHGRVSAYRPDQSVATTCSDATLTPTPFIPATKWVTRLTSRRFAVANVRMERVEWNQRLRRPLLLPRPRNL